LFVSRIAIHSHSGFIDHYRGPLPPNFGDAWVERGVCLEALRDYAAAEDCFVRACAAMPNSAHAHALLLQRRGLQQGLDQGVPACRAAHLFGVLSERDHTRRTARPQRSSKDARVADFMTP
jgi:hypothetical protein